MSAIWNLLFVNPILNALVFLYKNVGDLGFAIIFLTLIIRALLIPLVMPSMKSMKKQRELQPEINALKKKYKGNQQELSKKQMELFKQHGINPASGCLSQIAMIIVLIALFNVIRMFTLNGDFSAINSHIFIDSLKFSVGDRIDTQFLYLDLSKPDKYFILAILSGALQFVASKMTMPYIKQAEKAAEKTETKTDDMAFQIQQQSLYMMPIMNVMFGITLPSGLMLYIVTQTIFTIVQTYYLNGWGGLKPFINKLKSGNLLPAKSENKE